MLPCVDAARRAAHGDAEASCATAMRIATELSSFDRASDARPTRLYGEAIAALGRHEEAVASFETVIARLRPIPVFSLDRALALRDLGHSLTALERSEEALRAYRQADQQFSEALAGAERDSPFRAAVIGHMRSFLPEYARLLDQGGRADDATRVRAQLAAVE
jgi:tetratricopeptide (TPR) repeat protein